MVNVAGKDHQITNMGWLIIAGIILTIIIIVIVMRKKEGMGTRFLKKLKDCCKHRT